MVVGNISKTTHNPDMVVFKFSSYRLNNHEKLLLCRGLTFAILPKNIKYYDYLITFELLFRNVNFQVLIKNVLRVDYGIVPTHLLNKLRRFLTKIYQMKK